MRNRPSVIPNFTYARLPGSRPISRQEKATKPSGRRQGRNFLLALMLLFSCPGTLWGARITLKAS